MIFEFEETATQNARMKVVGVGSVGTRCAVIDYAEFKGESQSPGGMREV